MTDTAFWAGPEAAPRLAALYAPGRGGTATRFDAFGQAARARPRMISGGGGLVSTAAVYDRFTQLLLPRPGSADLTVSFFTQLLPSSTYPILPQLRQLVYQALVR